MQDEGVPQVDWLHSSGEKVFKIDLTEIMGAAKPATSLAARKEERKPKQLDCNINLRLVQQEKKNERKRTSHKRI